MIIYAQRQYLVYTYLQISQRYRVFVLQIIHKLSTPGSRIHKTSPWTLVLFVTVEPQEAMESNAPQK